MKLLIALFSVLTLNFAYAETGTIESYFSPSLTDHDTRVHLYLQNSCYQEIYVATRTLNPNGVWETKGFVRVFPGQVIYLTDMKENIYYLHGFTGDRSVYWKGKHKFELHGHTLKAALVELPKEYNGNWTTVLYCR